LIAAACLLLAGCEQPAVDSVLLTAGEVGAVPDEALSQPASIPARLDDELVWELFSTATGKPRYLGRETLQHFDYCWSAEYDLESGSGLTIGCQRDGLTLLSSRPPAGEPHQMLVGSFLPATTWHYRALTDGPGLGALAALLAGLELTPGAEYHLTALDLRQQLDYELIMQVGQVESIATNWGERLCLPVELTPLGITAYLDEDGQPWLFHWQGGFAEKRPSD
jgi:hypothetical protein